MFTRIAPCRCSGNDGIQLHFCESSVALLVGILEMDNEEFWEEVPEVKRDMVREFAQIIKRDIAKAMVLQGEITRGEREDSGPDIIVADTPEAILELLTSLMNASNSKMN